MLTLFNVLDVIFDEQSINYYYNRSNTRLLLLIIAAPEMTEERGKSEETRGREEAEGGDRRGIEEGR